jgi:hypothetical protein
MYGLDIPKSNVPFLRWRGVGDDGYVMDRGRYGLIDYLVLCLLLMLVHASIELDSVLMQQQAVISD